MVFDVYFDKSLWLMVSGSMQGKERIMKLIDSLPQEFYEKLHDAIEKYREYKYDEISTGKKRDVCFYGEVETSDGHLYWFDIDANEDTLKIGEYVLTRGFYVNNMDVTLRSFKRNNLDSQFVGKVCYGYSKITNKRLYIDTEHSEIEYSLMKTPIGRILVEKNSKRIIGRSVRRAKVNDIPYDYSVDGLHKLIRRKKQRNRFTK